MSRPAGRHFASPPRRWPRVVPVVVAAGVLTVGAALVTGVPGTTTPDAGDTPARGTAPGAPPGPVGSPPPSTPTTPAPPPEGEGRPWGTAVPGLLTFRGNPTRTFHGRGPVPADPVVAWEFPATGGMCAPSTVGGETRIWCGTGWTGQPAVFDPPWDPAGRRWLAFGAYDRAVHILEATTGERILPDVVTGDIIKGTVTVDPDGYPLLYTGSRDGRYRVIALDRSPTEVLWDLPADAVSPTMWNDDWDGSGLIVDDHLLIGGENSQLHIVRLGRRTGADGLVAVSPELVFHAPGWTDELVAAVGRNVSIESSVALDGDTLWFANSGGLVQGWDLRPLWDGTGEPRRTFTFWTGDDVDATVVVGDEGDLYVGVEYERALPRAREVGQILRLDPDRTDPVVWSVADHDTVPAGVWATPALAGDLVIVPTNAGRLLGIDRDTGTVRWELDLPGPTWSSPVVVDGTLIQGDCDGVLHAYDLTAAGAGPPPERWAVPIGGCIESTPAVWDGWIWVGTRAGRMVALTDPHRIPA